MAKKFDRGNNRVQSAVAPAISYDPVTRVLLSNIPGGPHQWRVNGEKVHGVTGNATTISTLGAGPGDVVSAKVRGTQAELVLKGEVSKPQPEPEPVPAPGPTPQPAPEPDPGPPPAPVADAPRLMRPIPRQAVKAGDAIKPVFLAGHFACDKPMSFELLDAVPGVEISRGQVAGTVDVGCEAGTRTMQVRATAAGQSTDAPFAVEVVVDETPEAPEASADPDAQVEIETSVEHAEPQPAPESADPVEPSKHGLAFGLSSVSYYSASQPFIDRLKAASHEWVAEGHPTKPVMKEADLHAAGHLNELNLPASIPEGYSQIWTLFFFGDQPDEPAYKLTGDFVILYEGEADIDLRGSDINNVQKTSGRITFNIPKPGTWFIRIKSITKPITAMHVLHVDDEEDFKNGRVYRQEYLDFHSRTKLVRFMDWQHTNGSMLDKWEQRSLPAGKARDDAGVSLEDQVRLCNDLQCEGWFNIPHLADDDYIRRAAVLVRDNLDPALGVNVEYSNEIWNWAFQQTQWALKQSREHWGQDAHYDWIAKKAVNMALIWREMFAEHQQSHRLTTILSTQSMNSGATKAILNPKTWQEMEPENYVEPASVFDALGVAHYFGGEQVSDAEERGKMLAAIKDPEVDATAWLTERLYEPTAKQSLPMTFDKLASQKRIANEYGLDLLAYEGGQHVHHSFAVRDLTAADLEILTGFLSEYVASVDMADLYEDCWRRWQEMGNGPFMQFGDIGKPGRYGSWHIAEGLDPDKLTLRGKRLFELAGAVLAE